MRSRRPFGLTPWAFWIVSVLLAGILGNIPLAGPALTVAVLLAAFVMWFRAPKHVTSKSRAHRRGAVPAGGQVLSQWGEIEVQGESYRRDALRRLFYSLGLPKGGVVHRMAQLEAEPSNPYDRHAVKVLIDDWHIGYVPAELSADVSRALGRGRGEAPIRVWADPRDGLWRGRATLFPAIHEADRDFAAERATGAPGVAAPSSDAVKVEHITASRVVDLRPLDSTRMRVKGVANWVAYKERSKVGGREYVLVREPRNEYDSNAIAVLNLSGRKVGYVSAARAKILAPVLDSIEADGFHVSGVGASDSSSQLWVDLPKADALRRFAKARV